jgi:NADH dehydrogenase
VIGVDAIVHTVGIIVEPAGVSFENTVLQGTKNLINAACNAGVCRFVYISAMGTRANAKSRYHQTKFAAEEYIRQSGMEYVILRPSIIFGPEDKFINKFLSMPVIPLPAGGRQRYQPIYVDDLAAIVLRAVEGAELKNLTLDAGGPEVLSFREMMRIALDAKGIHRPMVTMPLGAIGVMSTIFSPLQKLSPSLAPVTADQFLMMQEDNVGDNTVLLKALPEIQLTSLHDGTMRYMSLS